MDSGTAYGRQKPSYDAMVVEVGPGTPGGEMLRRYWHPVAVAAEVTSRPRNVRVLGEDLVLFRDGEGRPGLLYPRCCHRGTTLYYGKVEASGIRCCYHGFLFDVEGRCLDMPCEPPEKNQSERTGGFRSRGTGPGLHVLLFPLGRRGRAVAAHEGSEDVTATRRSGQRNISAGGDTRLRQLGPRHETVWDPVPRLVLHSSNSGNQFGPAHGVLPEVSWEPPTLGGKSYQPQALRRQGVPPRDRSHDAHAAHRRQPVREALRPDRVRGLDPARR